MNPTMLLRSSSNKVGTKPPTFNVKTLGLASFIDLLEASHLALSYAAAFPFS